MDSLKQIDDLQKINKQRFIFIIAIVCFFIWLISSIISLSSDIIPLTEYLIFYRIIYVIGAFCYALLIVCFAKYMQILSFKMEYTFSYIAAAFVLVSAIFYFVFSLHLERNAGSEKVYALVSTYSSLAMFINIIQNLSMLVLGILLIIRKNTNVEGLKIVGFLCILKVVFNIGSYLFQMISMQMETYYGVFGDYTIIIVITSFIYFFANLVFAVGIVYFLSRANQKNKELSLC